MGAAGCVTHAQRPVIATPAAHTGDGERPLRLLPPYESAASDDAIVRITGDVTCTGTLIADDRVLTAHHCVAARDAAGHALDHDKEPSELTIELGGDYLPWGDVSVSRDVDIAILVLSRHLIGIPTAPVRLESAPLQHETGRVVGFGRCALSRDGIHRATRTADPIRAVEAGHTVAIAAICPGDSGGPVYGNTGEVIGVVSASVMDGDTSTQGLSFFTRVDVWPQIFSAAHEVSNSASPSELPPYGECPVPARARPRPRP